VKPSPAPAPGAPRFLSSSRQRAVGRFLPQAPPPRPERYARRSSSFRASLSPTHEQFAISLADDAHAHARPADRRRAREYVDAAAAA